MVPLQSEQDGQPLNLHALMGGWALEVVVPLLASLSVSAQLFLLDLVKLILAVVSSQRSWQAASKDSMRWSAMSGSLDCSNCLNRALHSSVMHRMYIRLKPRGILARVAFWIAPRTLWYASSTLIVFTGIKGIVRLVAAWKLSQSAFLKFHLLRGILLTIGSWRVETNMEDRRSVLTVGKIAQHSDR